MCRVQALHILFILCGAIFKVPALRMIQYSLLILLLSVCGAQKLHRLVAPATFDRGTNYALPFPAIGGGRARYQIYCLVSLT